MSNLDVYCVFHFDEKHLFAHMGELGLTLDPKDFATNGYQNIIFIKMGEWLDNEEPWCR